MTALGLRPTIEGCLGWQWDTAEHHLASFLKCKNLGITSVRLMQVLTASNDWSQLTAVIDMFDANGMSVILCAGNIQQPEQEPDPVGNGNKFTSLIQYLIETYGIEQVNTMEFELFNEYGWGNLTELLDAYYTSIIQLQTDNPGLQIKTFVCGMNREDTKHLEITLAYCQQKQYPVSGISVHYYRNGISGHILTHKEWIAQIEAIIAAHGYNQLPLYITEFGYNGMNNDANLKGLSAALWCVSRLIKPSFYASRAKYFISAAYGQPFDNEKQAGFIGIYVGWAGSNAAYPIARALEMEAKLQGNITQLTDLPDGVSGVIDEQGTCLIWAQDTGIYTITLPSDREHTIALLNAQNGNSEYVMGQMNTLSNKYFWMSKKNSALLEQRSSPWNDPLNGNSLQSLASIDNVLTVQLQSPGIMLIQ